MKCIDLYSGIGGWTLGMKLSGIENTYSFEWNKESNQTHNENFGTSIKETNVRELEITDLPLPKDVDFIVGSPPCTQFSFSNRGGGGDIQDGLIDIYKFLSVVEYLKPKYWVMENVPRVKSIIEFLTENDPKFKKFKKLISFNEIVNTYEYGVPQKRKRMICGNFPFKLFNSYKSRIKSKNLGDVIVSLSKEKVVDINYNYKILNTKLTDHNKEKYLDPEEERINKENKTHHPIYNGMSFPDSLEKPSRTITSTCTRVSRESIIVEDTDRFRRLTLREKSSIQGFPITFQFYGKNFSSKQKMIGNSIPPILTYYLFQSMLETPISKLTLVENVKSYLHEIPKSKPPNTPNIIPKKKYRPDRSFKFSIKGLRFGSGIRFEFSNSRDKKNWSVKFYYGNSKKINELLLGKKTLKLIKKNFSFNKKNLFVEHESLLNLNSKKLQKSWSNLSEEYDNFKVLDSIGIVSDRVVKSINIPIDKELLTTLLKSPYNKKLDSLQKQVISGIYVGSLININIK